MTDDRVDRALAGDRTAAFELTFEVRELAAAKAAGLDPLLDRIAVQAVSDPTARLLLLEIVHGAGLARGAIAQVITDIHAVDDVEQQVVMAVERGIGGFAGRSRFRSWLYRVAHNEALMHLRRNRRLRDALARPGDDDRSDGDEAHHATGHPHLSSQVATRADLRAAVDGLAPHHRDVIELRLDEQLSYQEIADRLGIELNTVRSRLNAAKRRLATALGEGARPGR